VDDELWLDPDTMRNLGYLVVDRLAEHLADPRAHRLIVRATREELESRLFQSAPEQGEGFDGLLDRLWTDVIPYASRGEHPGYFAFIPSCHTWIGALGDLIASGTNMYTGSWMDGAGPTQLELTVLDWFRTWLGLPDTAAGVLVSGGSAANITALACARESLIGAMTDQVVAYVGDQAHSSIARAARTLGFRPDQVRVLPTGDDLRLSPDVVARAIEIDRERGLQPLLVAAAGGATNTGVVDPLPQLAEVCRREGLWLHVDAAYGGFGALTERGRAELAGIDLADSVTLDPHKWLYQPFECGAVLVRDGDLLRRAFQVNPDYLHDTEAFTREVNFSDRGLQLTRMSRAVKIWLTIRFFGLGAIRRAIDRCLDLAEHAERRIRAEPSLELLHERAMSTVCFRRQLPGADEEHLAEVNASLVRETEATGKALVSSTHLKGRYAVRMCVLNHTSETRDVDLVIDLFASSPAIAGKGGGSEERRSASPGRWLARERPELAPLRAVPLLATLDEDRLERVMETSHVESIEAGRTIVARWESSRDFYVILEGTAAAEADGQTLNAMETGDFFGELAALDWGSGYGYPRLATVVARTDVRMLVIPSLLLNELVREVPAFAVLIRGAVQARLLRLRE
jgi:aromatic-L-amino-acid decarboxylase